MEQDASQDFAPRHNSYLLGHQEAEQMFLNAWKNNSLHNSWLISGVEGIGKATLTYKLARFLLSADASNKQNYTSIETPPDHPVYNLISHNSHPDLKIIERDFTETDRKKVIKAIKDGDSLSADELKDLKKSAFIRIDDVRTINDFLSRRSSNDGWRIVIIDSIDDMNPAAANAVLKVLEEPPHQTLMLLISHNPNRLLATIKSRCAKLELKPLEDQVLAGLLRRYRPQLSEAQIKKVSAIASGSIGKALNYADQDAASRYENLCAIIARGKQYTINEVVEFAASSTIDEDSFNLSRELILKFLSEQVRQSTKIIEFADCWDHAVKVFAEVDRLNLDKKQAMLNILVNMCKNL